MEKIFVSNIQRFSLHDGPGIRTTVFLKGCSLHCPWCSNPENISAQENSSCLDNAISGKRMSIEEIYDEVVKDKAYYENGGGVTFSGGESLLQIKALVPLLERLKAEGVHLCVETSLFVKRENIETALKYIDLFYVDIKILDKAKCTDILGGDIEEYLSNIRFLFKQKVNVVLRIPMIGKHIATKDNLELIIDLLQEIRPMKIELLEAHNLGASKYKMIGKQVPLVEKTEDEIVDWFSMRLKEIGVQPVQMKL